MGQDGSLTARTGEDLSPAKRARSLNAICAGIVTLMESEGLTASDISTLYIAGGFGNYLNKASAAKIGLLPDALARVSKAVGNAALTGAAMILLNTGIKDEAEEIAKKAKTLDLSTSPVFSDQYMSGMMLGEV